MPLLHEKLVFAQKEFANSTEAISFIAKELFKNGYVKNDFAKAVLDREKIFPTGLPTGSICVAIPHADSKYVNQSTLGVVTLKKPVIFKNMGDPDEDLAISIIINMAISEPHGQVPMLQKIMNIVQNQDYLKKLLSCNDATSLFKNLKNSFGE